MCNLHWCYTFCTGVTLFALVLHLNCTAFSQSESSNFFMFISLISIGNRTEWSPIQSVIIRVITKSDDRAAGVQFVYHEYDYRLNRIYNKILDRDWFSARLFVT